LFLPSHQIPNLAKIYLIGFYEEREFALYVSSISNDLKLPVRYLKEDKPHGSAGGLYNFKDLIMEEDPVFIFITYQFLHLLYANLLVLVLC
jgi:mannose-1-phosphate guanylyltransferase